MCLILFISIGVSTTSNLNLEYHHLAFSCSLLVILFSNLSREILYNNLAYSVKPDHDQHEWEFVFSCYLVFESRF